MSSLLALLALCGDQGDTIARGTVVSRDGFQPVELGFARFDENLFHRAHGDSVQPQNTNVAADVDFARRFCGSDFPCTAHAPQPSGVLPTLASSTFSTRHCLRNVVTAILIVVAFFEVLFLEVVAFAPLLCAVVALPALCAGALVLLLASIFLALP